VSAWRFAFDVTEFFASYKPGGEHREQQPQRADNG